MVTTQRPGPQLRFGETMLEDDHLLQLLVERDAAKAAYEDARGYLEDYCESQEFLPGEYRVGPFRVKFGRRNTISISTPKK